MPGRVVIALATNLLVRGFMTAAPGKAAQSGEPTHALYVLTRALSRALAFKEPALAVAVLDADPEAVPAELRSQQARLVAPPPPEASLFGGRAPRRTTAGSAGRLERAPASPSA